MRPVKNHKLFIEICKLGNFSFVTIGGTHRRLEGHVNDIEKMVRANARNTIDYVPGFVSDMDMLDLINQSRSAKKALQTYDDALDVEAEIINDD